ncbi:MAG: hypothetical protein JXR91_04365 [Deltaproteobacteria bacterium]|nr:hypothetical protein [Deltaproteobacteria bacterium]
MNSVWLYQNLGTLAQIGGAAALILIAVLSVHRKNKKRKLVKIITQKRE